MGPTFPGWPHSSTQKRATRPSGSTLAVALTVHTRCRSTNEAVARSSSALLHISAP